MSVNIQNINGLLIGEMAGTPSTWVNMGLTEQSPCHNFKLTGTSLCNDLSDTTIYLDIPAFDGVDYIKTVKSIEISPGNDLETWKSINPKITFTIYGDETLHNLLQILAAHENITFTNISQGLDEIVQSVDIAKSPDGVLLQLKVTLGFKDAETISTICCGSYYEDAPFTECDGEGQVSDPNNEAACNNYTAIITLTTAPDVLTATTTGGSTGIETFKWYKDGVYFGSGSSINPVASGVYRVDAKKGNCSDSESFTFSIGCDGFTVTTETIVLEDGNVIYVAIASLVSTYQWQEEIATVWTDIDGETGTTYQPSASGTFRVVATAGTCVANSDSLVFTLATSCDNIFTITLVNVAGTLTVTIVDYIGTGTPNYQWFLDTGSGSVLLASETGATITTPDPGYYTVVVTLDECPQSAGLLVQCDFAAIDSPCADDSAWSQSFDGDGTSTSFAVTNFLLPDPAHTSVVEINATLLVQVNGVSRQYQAPPADGIHYGINYAAQTITLNAGFPLQVGEVLTVTKLKWIQI